MKRILSALLLVAMLLALCACGDDKKDRKPINEVVSGINAKASLIPGVVMLLHAEPTLKISTGAVSTQQGKYQFAITSMDSNELYAAAGKLMARMYQKYGTYFSSISSASSGTQLSPSAPPFTP